MSCCDTKRTEWAHSSIDTHHAPIHEVSTFSPKPDVIFEYIGQTGLTVIGIFTNNKYRFAFSGDKQAIDYRDAGSCMAIGVLKKVKAAM
jgi:hypothetical protein